MQLLREGIWADTPLNFMWAQMSCHHPASEGAQRRGALERGDHWPGTGVAMDIESISNSDTGALLGTKGVPKMCWALKLPYKGWERSEAPPQQVGASSEGVGS